MCRYEEPGGSGFLVADHLPPCACKQFVITKCSIIVYNKTASKDALICYQQQYFAFTPDKLTLFFKIIYILGTSICKESNQEVNMGV